MDAPNVYALGWTLLVSPSICVLKASALRQETRAACETNLFLAISSRNIWNNAVHRTQKDLRTRVDEKDRSKMIASSTEGTASVNRCVEDWVVPLSWRVRRGSCPEKMVCATNELRALDAVLYIGSRQSSLLKIGTWRPWSAIKCSRKTRQKFIYNTQFHWSASLNFRSNWSDCTTEHIRGWRPFKSK